MKYIGIVLLLLVFVSSPYLIFKSDFGTTQIELFAAIGIIIGIFFVISDRLISAETPFLKLKARAVKDAKEIEEILTSIKSQKDIIDLILRDANTAHLQLSQIATIANEAHLKAQELEAIMHDVNSKTQQIEQLAANAVQKAEETHDDLNEFKKSSSEYP